MSFVQAGLPFPWVNLRHGVHANETVFETNTAAVGSFSIEMGVLSRLTGMTPQPSSMCMIHEPFLDPKHAQPVSNPLVYPVPRISDGLGITERCVPAGQPIFERCARQALRALWRMRTPLGLFGTSLDMMQGMWLDNNGGIGASADSFYEYLLKAHILFGACLAGHAHRLGSSGLTKQATRPCALYSALQLLRWTLFRVCPMNMRFGDFL